jgi:aryl sulfotransferase
MGKRLPERTQIYDDFFSDSRRWDRFEHRSDDIFVCTPPKCGTTWTQAICALLVFQTPDLEVNPAAISPWFDAKFIPIDHCLAMLEGQTHRRIIKTHTPLDGIPYFEDADYLCVYRDPRDMFFSLQNHIANMKIEVPREQRDIPPAEAFREWVDHDFHPGDGEGSSLGGVTHHLDTTRAHRDLPNIGLYHYADMTRDLPREMKRIASQLDITVEPALLARLADTAGFAHMQKNAGRFAPGLEAQAWHDETRFFNKGGSGQWREFLVDDDDRHCRETLRKLLPQEWAGWLLDGSGGEG